MFLTMGFVSLALLQLWRQRVRQRRYAGALLQSLGSGSVWVQPAPPSSQEDSKDSSWSCPEGGVDPGVSSLVSTPQACQQTKLLCDQHLQAQLVSPKLRVDLKDWTSYLDMHTKEGSEGVDVLLEATRRTRTNTGTSTGTDASQDHQGHTVMALEHGLPLAWKSGEPFGVILRCSHHHFVQLCDALGQGTLLLDHNILLKHVLTVSTEGRPSYLTTSHAEMGADTSSIKPPLPPESALLLQTIQSQRSSQAAKQLRQDKAANQHPPFSLGQAGGDAGATVNSGASAGSQGGRQSSLMNSAGDNNQPPSILSPAQPASCSPPHAQLDKPQQLHSSLVKDAKPLDHAEQSKSGSCSVPAAGASPLTTGGKVAAVNNSKQALDKKTEPAVAGSKAAGIARAAAESVRPVAKLNRATTNQTETARIEKDKPVAVNTVSQIPLMDSKAKPLESGSIAGNERNKAEAIRPASVSPLTESKTVIQKKVSSEAFREESQLGLSAKVKGTSATSPQPAAASSPTAAKAAAQIPSTTSPSASRQDIAVSKQENRVTTSPQSAGSSVGTGARASAVFKNDNEVKSFKNTGVTEANSTAAIGAGSTKAIAASSAGTAPSTIGKSQQSSKVATNSNATANTTGTRAPSTNDRTEPSGKATTKSGATTNAIGTTAPSTKGKTEPSSKAATNTDATPNITGTTAPSTNGRTEPSSKAATNTDATPNITETTAPSTNGKTEPSSKAATNSDASANALDAGQPAPKPKAPNVLVFCGVKDSARLFSVVKWALEQCLNRDSYTVQQLGQEELERGPWQDSCRLLLLSHDYLLDSVSKRCADFLMNGGTVLSFASSLEAQFVKRSECRQRPALGHFTLGQWKDVWAAQGRYTYVNAGLKMADSSMDTLVRDAKTGDPIVIQLTLSAQHQHGKAIFSQLLLERDAGGLALDSRSLRQLKQCEEQRLAVLRHLLSLLDLDTSPAPSPNFTPAFLIAQDAALKKKLMDSLANRIKQGSIRSRDINLQFVSAKSGLSGLEASRDTLPVVTDMTFTSAADTQHVTLFEPQVYWRHLTSAVLGRLVLYTEVIPTTMTVFSGIQFSLPEDVGVVAIAGRQTGGKGRGGNTWLSPAGCAMFSVPLRLAADSPLGQAPAFLQHIAALAIVTAVRSLPGYQDVDLRLKWPNDIYDGAGVKVGGVLVTSTVMGNKLNATIGCGVNVSNTRPSVCINSLIQRHNQGHGTDLPPLTPSQVTALSLSAMETSVTRFQEKGAQDFCQRYYQYWLHSGARVRVESEGQAQMEIVGLDRHGYLEVLNQQGQRLSLHPDGNSFDMMRNLLTVKRQ